MSLAVLGLLVVAALLHASWNLLVKQAGGKQVFTWWALLCGAALFTPVLLIAPPLPARAWPFVIASALVETFYFFALSRAYRLGDFSLVYPLARGTAPALLVVWAALFLRERPNQFGALGLGLLVGGLLVIGGGLWWARRGLEQVGPSGIGAALIVALSISTYSLIDGAAVRFAPPVTYTVLILSLTALFASPLIAVQYGRAALALDWRTNWWRVLLVGLLNFGSYMLVLVAYSQSKVGYVGAVREMSVVIAALIGWRWLNEGFGLSRTIGACLIFAGIVLIAALGR